jgi:predicted DNA-binding transcriptional regulator AlpA
VKTRERLNVQPAETSGTPAFHTPLPQVGFVRLPTILAVFPVGKSTWWAGIRSGRYPAPVKLGPRVSAWRVEEIRELLDALGNEARGR